MSQIENETQPSTAGRHAQGTWMDQGGSQAEGRSLAGAGTGQARREAGLAGGGVAQVGGASGYKTVTLPSPWTLPQGRTLVMGILNVTPDSFSDGGLWDRPEVAIAHARDMMNAGADLIDVGGESTRPHSTRLTSDQEWERIGGVLKALVSEGIVVSVDTIHAETARRASDLGVAIINDVSGGRFDPDMNATVAGTDCAFLIQHYRQFPGQPDEDFDYGDDVVGTIIAETLSQVDDALAAGVRADRIIVDPGLGFSLKPWQGWELVNHLDQWAALDYPTLVGASRKRFLHEPPAQLADQDLEELTRTITQWSVQAHMWGVRVHNVEGNVALVRG